MTAELLTRAATILEQLIAFDTTSRG